MNKRCVGRDDISNSADAVTDGTGFSRRIEGGVNEDVGFEARFPGMATGASQCDRLSNTVDDYAAC